MRGNKAKGEIRVKVILTNSADEMANRRRKLKKSAIRGFELSKAFVGEPPGDSRAWRGWGR